MATLATEGKRMQRMKKTIWRTAMCCLASAFPLACNSRPTYDIEVFDVTSNCAGEVLSRFEYDPEPEAPTLKFEPAYQQEAEKKGLRLAYEPGRVNLYFGEAVVCAFGVSSDLGECVDLRTGKTADCTAERRIYCFRYPSRGPGYRPPFAEPGKDYFPPKEGCK